MNKYSTILFDADDTLLDFGKTEEQALSQTLSAHGVVFTSEINQLYQNINHRLWRDFEQNLLDKDTLLESRFKLLFEALNIAKNSELDAVAFNKEYLNNLGKGSYLMPYALETCTLLVSLGCRLYIVTNGVSKTQYQRVNSSAIASLISGIFVSEDTGYQKPMKEYFEAVFPNIPSFNSKSTLIVGDSLTSDMQGGYNIGIDSCWYNPKHLCNNNNSLHPTYEIENLIDLQKIVKVNMAI